jgi:hypothetical protein
MIDVLVFCEEGDRPTHRESLRQRHVCRDQNLILPARDRRQIVDGLNRFVEVVHCRDSAANLYDCARNNKNG